MSKERDMFDDSQFGADSEMKPLTVDWGLPGDYIAGTFLRARHGVETQFGVNSIYEILAERGQYHKLTKKKPADSPTLIEKGNTYSIWGRNDLFNGQMNSLKPGQVVKITFAETAETKMGESKIIKINAPKNNDGTVVMNQLWLDQQGVTGADF